MNNKEILNGTWETPFTCIINGPSGCGKTTFVKNLILDRDLLPKPFKYIVIFLGTSLQNNSIFEDLFLEFGDWIKIVEVGKLYGKKELEKGNFASDCLDMITGPNGCFIFDDLMSELSKANILTDLFTKVSSHHKISIIHITQNLFQTSSKNPHEAMNTYRNAKYIVLFSNRLDNTTNSTIAKRLAGGTPKAYRKILDMFKYVMDKYRYIVINGGLNANNKIQYTSDIFQKDPIPHQKVFQIT